MLFGWGKNPLVSDHRDGDGLNNQRENLRACTSAQNNCNRKKGDTRNLVKGVEAKNGKFRARIVVAGRRIDLGTFRALADAELAYQKAAVQYHGEYACFGVRE